MAGSTKVDFLRRWAPLDAMAKFGTPTITIALAWVFFGEGTQGFWSGARGGGEKVSTMLVSIGMVGGLTPIFDVGCSTPYFSMKKYWGGMMLVCC